MFDRLKKNYDKKIQYGRITKDDPKIIAQEGFLGNIFGSKEDRDRRDRESALKALHMTMIKTEEDIANTSRQESAYISKYVSDLDTIAQDIKGKFFDQQAFANLTFPNGMYNYKVLEHGLEHIPDVKHLIDFIIGRISSNPLNDHYYEEFDLHSKNSAYLVFDEEVFVPRHVGSFRDLGYYAVAPGEKVTSGGYTENFITHLIATKGTTISGIRTVINSHQELSRFANLIKQKIETMTDPGSGNRSPAMHAVYKYEQLAWLVHSAIRCVSHEYPQMAILVTEHIAKNCYKYRTRN